MTTFFKRRQRPTPYHDPYRPTAWEWLIMAVACILLMVVR